jgi:SPP1 gp7 family putative phage head morphogenesis protein
MPSRKRELVGSPAPRGLELELRRALRPMLAQVKATLPRIKTAADARAVGVALRKAWPDKRIRSIVSKIMIKVGVRSAKGWGKWERAAEARRPKPRGKTRKGDAEDLIEKWTRAAVEKITNVRDEVAEALRRDIVAAVDLGMSATDLQAEWARNGVPTAYGSLEGRLKVISQHQIASLHARIQAERAGAIGATEFEWVSQEDDRVRDKHVELHGRILPYPDGDPTEGLPGEPINCRCFALAVVPPELTIPIGSAFDT